MKKNCITSLKVDIDTCNRSIVMFVFCSWMGREQQYCVEHALLNWMLAEK